MSQHFRKGVKWGDIVNWPWINGKLDKTIFGRSWEWKSGYYMKHITRTFTDSEISKCDIHITVNALDGNSTKWRVNSPHVTFQYEGQVEGALHVYYDFVNESDKVNLKYLYTDRSDDKKWRESAFIILRDDSGWNCPILGDHSGD